MKVISRTPVPADLLQHACIENASALIKLGARRSTVMSLCKGLSDPAFKRLSLELQGTPGQQGRSPDVTSYYFSKPTMQIQATTIASIYLCHRDGGSARAESLILAYRFFLDVFSKDEQLINIDRAFVLTRHIEQQTILAEICPDCGSLVLRDIDTPLHRSACLTCKPVRKSRRSVAIGEIRAIAA